MCLQRDVVLDFGLYHNFQSEDLSKSLSETHRVLKGESIFFQKDTWHHAFNYSEEYLQVLEFFSPPPITGTSGQYAKEKKLLTKSIYNRGNYFYPSDNFKNQKSFKIIKNKDYVWSLEGNNQETLIGTMVKSENLDVKMINLKPFQESHIFCFENNTSYLSLNDNIEIKILDENQKILLSKNDGLYFPKSTSYKIKNLNDHEANIIFCIGL